MSVISEADAQTFYDVCNVAADPQIISQELTRLLNRFGIGAWYVGSVVHEAQLTAGDFGMFHFAHDNPIWRKQYAEENLCKRDIIFRHAATSWAPIRWSACKAQAVARGIDKRSLSVFDAAAEYGLRDGFTKSWHFGGAPIACTMAGEDPDLSDVSQRTLLLIGMAAFSGFSRIVQGFRPIPPQMTAKEFDVVRWYAAGKTAWEIGEIMDITQATVRTHQNNLKRKFGVTSMVQVVARVLTDGLTN